MRFSKNKSRLLAVVGAAAIISVAAAVNFTDSDKVSSVSAGEKSAVKTTDALKVYHFAQYKKAVINEYDMSFVHINGAKANKGSTSGNDFDVTRPKDNGSYPDEKPSPQRFYSTRSIANEYYTVYDQISGKTVTLNGHDLICQVVYSEVGDHWGEESIKAQAVAAYSYVRFHDDVGMTATVGLKEGYTPKLERCVSAVEGQVVAYNGKTINAVYSASTAGCSTSSKDVWGTDYPYLRAVKSSYDYKDPHWGETKEYTVKQVKDKLEKALDIKLSDNKKNWFKIQSVYSKRYINKISIDGKKVISGVDLCNALDITSNAMDIGYKDGKFIFKCYGWGHGVGFSQWGSRLYAQKGWTYDQILRHYYLGTSVVLSNVNQAAVERKAEFEAEQKAAAANAVIKEKKKNKDDKGTDKKVPEQTESSSAEAETDEGMEN